MSTTQLKAPAGMHLPATLTHATLGAFVIAPQGNGGAEVLIGKQRRFEADPGREGWAAMAADKEALVGFLRANNEGMPEMVRNAVTSIPRESLNLWPFYVVPRLERWGSEAGKVLILGDAAHAIPPSAGQGINQAFEDTYVLAELLHAAGGEKRKVRGRA